MDPASLICSICSKRPQFSDISHLLTHISSKAHLASHFKLQIQSKHNPQALENLSQYDRWYMENDIARLLSDRMASSAKANRRRQSNRSVGTEADVSSQSSVGIPADNIDPRLSGMQQPLTNGHHKVGVSLVTPYGPSEPLGPKLEPESPHLSEIDGIPWFGHYGSHYHPASQKSDPFSAELSQAPVLKLENLPFSGLGTDLGAEDKKVDEVSRLKGIQWPGMDCFDAASDTMKRQRNQKKDASAFKAMEKASCASEPSELVFSPSGTLRKEREITGFVEEDDLLPGEWTVPKSRRDHRDRRSRGPQEPSTPRRRQRSQRVALAVTDPNRLVLGSRVTKREHQPKRRIAGAVKRQEPVIRANSTKTGNHGLSHGHYRRGNGDDEEELALSMGTTGRRLKSRLNIFKDDESNKAEKKRHASSPDMAPRSATRSEQHDILYQRASDAVHTMLEPTDSFRIPTLSDDSGPFLEPGDSHNRAALASTSRNIDGIYLVDPSLGPNHRISYDPLVGGNVLHYRWDCSELGRGLNDGDDTLLAGGLFYDRGVSTDTTIFQDDQETKNCLWLDGYSH